MIRAAFLGVLLIAGFLAFLAFSVGRGTEGEITEIPAATPEEPTPEVPETPEVERLFFLRGIDLDEGDITLVLMNAGPTPLVVRDPAALKAAQDRAYVNTTTTGGQAAGSLLLAIMGTPPEEVVAQVYRDDTLIASVTCTNAACGSFAESPDIDYAGLLATAQPVQLVEDAFESYDQYLATIDAIAADPDFMLLHARPAEGFPEPRRLPHLIVEFPTVIAAAGSPFDPAQHEAQLRGALTSLLPQDATIDWVRITDQGFAVLADKDNNRPVLVDGAEIAFLDAQFFSVQARISGITSLPPLTYESLTASTLRQDNIDAAFAAFVRGSLPSECVDCNVLKVEGDVTDTARTYDWRSEIYYLSYFDLREAP